MKRPKIDEDISDNGSVSSGNESISSVGSGNEGGNIKDSGDSGCVYHRDNIPDDEFFEMLHKDKPKSGTRSSELETESRGMTALILVPTRELALQVKAHIETAAKYTNIMVRREREREKREREREREVTIAS